MARGGWLVTGLSVAVVLGSFGGFAWYAASILPPPEAGTGGGETATVEPVAEKKPHAASGLPVEIRDVGGSAVEAPVEAGEPLERVAPPPRPQLQVMPASGPEKPKSTRLFGPVVVAAGTIAAGDHVMALRGVIPTPVDRICRDASGQDWPCGTRARTALRGYLRGRAVVCDVAEGGALEVETDCTVSGRDIARWLVARGWVEVPDGSPYAELSDEARASGFGLFGSGADGE